MSQSHDPPIITITYDPPVKTRLTARTYLICTFATFGGILLGYSSGPVAGIFASFGRDIEPGLFDLPFFITLITAIPLGALLGGQAADWNGRRATIILDCLFTAVGVAIQVADPTGNVLLVGLAIQGFGTGGLSTNLILYVSEISPQKIRGSMVSVYIWAINVGQLCGLCVVRGTVIDFDPIYSPRTSFRTAIALQLVWAGILIGGFFLLPESPQYLVKEGKVKPATAALSTVYAERITSLAVHSKLTEIQTNYEYELKVVGTSWLDCFRGGLKASSSLCRILTVTVLLLFQQLTIALFLVVISTSLFDQFLVEDGNLMSLIVIDIVAICGTTFSFYAIERYGRRSLLFIGAVSMLIPSLIIAIILASGITSRNQVNFLLFLVFLYKFAFSITWGTTTFVLIGEIFPLPIRAKGVALSMAVYWLCSCVGGVVAVYVPAIPIYATAFIWVALCCLCLPFVYYCVPETKGLSLEEIGIMLEETTPQTSSVWIQRRSLTRDTAIMMGDVKVGSDGDKSAKEEGGWRGWELW